MIEIYIEHFLDDTHSITHLVEKAYENEIVVSKDISFEDLKNHVGEFVEVCHYGILKEETCVCSKLTDVGLDKKGLWFVAYQRQH